MPERSPKSWHYPGCKGRFYTRGKKNIIWYDLNRKPISLHLEYSKRNREIAGDIVAQEENPSIIIKDDSPRLISEAYEKFFKNEVISKMPGTQQNYSKAMRMFFDVDLNISQDIKSYLIDRRQEMVQRKLRANTINSYLQKLSSFFAYCIEQRWIIENPVKGMYLKEMEKPIEIWTPEELTRINEYTQKEDYQFYLFLNFLHKTAFRVNEAYTLDWLQVRHNGKWNDSITFIAKSHLKHDKFPLSEGLIQLINQLPMKEHGSVFNFNVSGPNVLRDHLVRILKHLEIPRFLYNVQKVGTGRSFHTYRRTRITEWLINHKLSPVIVSRLARDRVDTIMKYYTQFDVEDYSKYVDL